MNASVLATVVVIGAMAVFVAVVILAFAPTLLRVLGGLPL